jgi:membrane-anchored glycerophosphoryl diester phosphodiesterase (GDPDase)
MLKEAGMQQHENIAPPPIIFMPGVFSSYGNGWRQLWRHFLPLFLIGIIYVVLSYAIAIPEWIATGAMTFSGVSDDMFASVFSAVSFLYGIFFLYPLGYGQSFAYLRAARGENVEVQDLFGAFKNYWSAIGSMILVTIIVIVGLILLIVPGIIFACKLAFVPYLVVDKKRSVTDAIGESWRMTNGHAWKVFLIGLLAIPIGLVGLIILLVGVIISFMWVNAALASLYHAVDMQKNGLLTPAMTPVQTG